MSKNAPAAQAASSAFVSTMTFSLGVQRDCECDECGLCIREYVPKEISDAVRERKRLKLVLDLPRRQERVLVARDGGISIWRLIMPPGADPLVEYGNSHRIVLVDKIEDTSFVWSIGKGILGSSDEERCRIKMPWREGRAYLIPCNGGKALGWINKNSDSKEEGTDVVAFMVKITPEAMKDTADNAEFTPRWVREILHVFQQHLPKCDDNPDEAEEHAPLIVLDGSVYIALSKILPPLMKTKGFYNNI